MVESGGLENRCAGNPCTVGSNPTPSAGKYRQARAQRAFRVYADGAFNAGARGVIELGPVLGLEHEVVLNPLLVQRPEDSDVGVTRQRANRQLHAGIGPPTGGQVQPRLNMVPDYGYV